MGEHLLEDGFHRRATSPADWPAMSSQFQVPQGGPAQGRPRPPALIETPGPAPYRKAFM